MFHTWMSTDTEEHDSCLDCGGMWQVAPEHPTNWTSPRHTASNGDSPTPCTNDNLQCHHYEDECPRAVDPDDSRCFRRDACNCLFCN